MKPVVARRGVDENAGEHPKSVQLNGEAEVALAGGREAQLRAERLERVALGVLNAAADRDAEADESGARERRVLVGGEQREQTRESRVRAHAVQPVLRSRRRLLRLALRALVGGRRAIAAPHRKQYSRKYEKREYCTLVQYVERLQKDIDMDTRRTCRAARGDAGRSESVACARVTVQYSALDYATNEHNTMCCVMLDWHKRSVYLWV